MNGAACPCCGSTLTVEFLVGALATAASARPKSERVAVRRGELWARIAVFLAEHPEASANAVHAAVGGRRQDALRAVREVRSRFLAAGNHVETETR